MAAVLALASADHQHCPPGSHTQPSKPYHSAAHVCRTYLWVVGAQLINGTELDQFLIDAGKGTEQSVSRVCIGPTVLGGTRTISSWNYDKPETHPTSSSAAS